MRYLIFIVILFFTNIIKAQCKNIKLEGVVFDTNSTQQFYNLIIYNKTTNKGFFGSPDGSFNVEVKYFDTLLISVVGYVKKYVIINDLELHNCSSKIKLFLNPQTKKLNTVVIHPLKTLQQIKEEREKLAVKESIKMVEGIAIIQSPITALYERFSKRARTIKKINELKYEDEKQKILKELLSLYVEYDIINLSEKDFDLFISFLNLNDEILKTTNDVELATFIKDKFMHFKSINQKR